MQAPKLQENRRPRDANNHRYLTPQAKEPGFPDHLRRDAGNPQRLIATIYDQIKTETPGVAGQLDIPIIAITSDSFWSRQQKLIKLGFELPLLRQSG
jgi:hypothetical protein